MQTTTIFNFSKKTETTDWTIANDVVMGGKSLAKIYVNLEGSGVFEGRISLENNGGFSSVRYRSNSINTKSYSKIILKVKGDGKRYQFRIKDKISNGYSYVTYFNSSTDWQTIEIPLSSMYPTFRGRKLNIGNYNSEHLEEIAFLIGNKKEESFKLEIDTVVLQ
ncbi:CIA30 family protein [Maribacter sp.]|uniref:CIA30 family protein n=1 Tax=Maribacter sp. TaxID=1897614 RepID=UPI0025C2B142|nr:CIA30 family protein [Maribacter sp.]